MGLYAQAAKSLRWRVKFTVRSKSGRTVEVSVKEIYEPEVSSGRENGVQDVLV